jgi:hypothetical protein
MIVIARLIEIRNMTEGDRPKITFYSKNIFFQRLFFDKIMETDFII